MSQRVIPTATWSSPLVEVRLAVLWSALLLAGQAADVFTTAVDMTRGTVESVALSASLLDDGGIKLLFGAKLLLVGAAAGVLLLAARRVHPRRHASVITFRLALMAIQAATIGLAWVSLSNVALLSSLSS
jgi:hypothetical protein